MFKKYYVVFCLIAMGYNTIGQDLEIVGVDPNTIPSEDTVSISIFLNKAPAPDISLLDVKIYGHSETFDSWNNITHYSEFTLTDSIISGEISVYNSNYGYEKDSVLINVILMEDGQSYWEWDSLIYHSFWIDDGISDYQPEICMVSQNTNHQNVVVWDAVSDLLLDSVVVYKETSVSGQFDKIGARSAEDTSYYTDYSSLNVQNSNRYKIAYVDTSGNESPISSAHKTMHLMINEGLNGSINLIWDGYQGFEFSTYHIYRGSTSDDMHKIADIASNLFSFSDNAAPLGTLYYQVVIENPSPCNVGFSKSTLSDFQYCRSNLVDNISFVGISDRKRNSDFRVFPNPSKGTLTIENQTGSFKVYLYDISGNLLVEQASENTSHTLSIESYPAGIYYLKVVDPEGTSVQKIIRE